MANRKAKFTTNVGEFLIELFEDKAPKTTKNFIDLAEKGYYNGLIFHRIIKDFMIQGGCPNVRFDESENCMYVKSVPGTGGPGYHIEDEFHPDLMHDSAGILSMANAGPNTGGSQFFITLVETNYLNNRHAVFGKVIEGMDIVYNIGSVKTVADRLKTDRGLCNVQNFPQSPIIMKKIEIID